MKLGIVPDRQFPPRSKCSIMLRLPNSLGIGPVRRLFDRISMCNPTELDKGGMGPYWRLGIGFEKGGMGPVNLLNERSKISKESFPRHVGMLPLK